MTRSEEQLHVGTERVETGRARLRKPITDGNLGAALDGPAISEEEHEVVLTAEKPVVQKQAVPVERIRVDKETVTEQAQITEDVRKEQVELEGADYPSGTDARSETELVEPRR